MTASQRIARLLLEQTAEEFRKVLKENLVGIYEHGSLSFGCFRWEASDIDFLVVVKHALRQEEKEELIRILLKLGERASKKGFEMSVVLARDVNPFKYPTPFELHYSNAHFGSVIKDLTGYCRTMQGNDRDLAAHCTVTRAKGRVILGEEIEAVFGEVPWEDYLDSIRYDIENAAEDILENPVYITLNLCRVLAAVQEGLILSKAEGGRWGAERLELRWHELISGALEAYEREKLFRADAAELKEFAGEMLAEMQDAIQTDRSLNANGRIRS